MKFDELVKRLKSRGYSFSTWVKDPKYRLYFNDLCKNADCFIEIELEDGNVVGCISKAFYTGKYVESPKWRYNFLLPYIDYLNDVVDEIYIIINE